VFIASASLVIASILFTASAGQTQSQAPLVVLSKEGRRTLPLSTVGDQEFVALDDLAEAFQLTVREDQPGKITVSYRNRAIVLTADQALASVAGRLVSLPAAPTRAGRRWLVPVEFVSRALALIYDARLDLRKAAHLLIAGDLRVPQVSARYDPALPGGRLTIDATPRTTSTVVQDGERLIVRFDADALDVAPPLPAPGPPSLVLAVRGGDSTSLIVDLGPRFGGFRSAAQPVDLTTRLVIDLIPSQGDAATAPPPVPPPELPPALGQQSPSIRTLAIDPGHGGDDDGVKGEGGTKEKDLTLAVAKQVKALVESRLGIRVVLTREDDRSVPIDDRTTIANTSRADLFVSLHVNSALRKTTAGASVYYASFDEDAPEPASPKEVERVPAFGGGTRDIFLAPWDLAQVRHLDRSMSFASTLEQQLRDRVALSSRSVGSAPLRVLEAANMPAVVFEMGFLSNRDQEKQLASVEFQTAATQALFDAVVKFRDSLSSEGGR
jgi:N-acetylmuramoyl-L-alanine amidase